MKPLPLLCLALGLTACQQLPPALPPGPVTAAQGHELARASCTGCHGIERYATSPNPDAPPFEAIVNQEGLTAATLSTWLRDAHNYPKEMEFSLGPREVDALVVYMLTLRDPNYKPPI